MISEFLIEVVHFVVVSLTLDFDSQTLCASILGGAAIEHGLRAVAVAASRFEQRLAVIVAKTFLGIARTLRFLTHPLGVMQTDSACTLG